jgi:hypothetical protein
MNEGDLVRYRFFDKLGTAIILEKVSPDIGTPSGPECYRVMTESGHDIVLNVAFMEIISEARRFSENKTISRQPRTPRFGSHH